MNQAVPDQWDKWFGLSEENCNKIPRSSVVRYKKVAEAIAEADWADAMWQKPASLGKESAVNVGCI